MGARGGARGPQGAAGSAGSVPAATDAGGTGASGASGTGAVTGSTAAGDSHGHAFTGTGITFADKANLAVVAPPAPDLVSIVAALDPLVGGAMTIVAQPAVPCKLQVRIVDPDASISAGTLTLVGIGARGQAVGQVIPLTGGTQTVVTADAYAKLTSATLASIAGAGAGDSVGIGQSSALGLPGAQGATGFAVFRLDTDGATEAGNGTVDATAGTVIPPTAPDGTHLYEVHFTYTITPTGTNAAESTHTHAAGPSLAGPSHTHTGPSHTHTITP